MATSAYEKQRSELEQGLKTERPHFDWSVRLDQSGNAQDAMLFIASRNDAGKTWQLSLPVERLTTDDVATLVDEIVEGMDDELSA